MPRSKYMTKKQHRDIFADYRKYRDDARARDFGEPPLTTSPDPATQAAKRRMKMVRTMQDFGIDAQWSNMSIADIDRMWLVELPKVAFRKSRTAKR